MTVGVAWVLVAFGAPAIVLGVRGRRAFAGGLILVAAPALVALLVRGGRSWRGLAGSALILAGVLVVLMTAPPGSTRMTACTRDLGQFGSALASYRAAHEGRLPPFGNQAFFPALNDAAALADDSRYETWSSGALQPHEEAAGTRVSVAWDATEHDTGRRCVLFLDGAVESLDREEFESTLRQAARDHRLVR